MNVSFTSYPIQEWILDEGSQTLGDVQMSLDAIAQDVKFAISTERNMYPIMGPNFGVELLDLIGQDASYVQAQIKRRISDALSIDDRISSISTFKFSQTDPEVLHVSFIVSTKIGDIQMTTDIVGR